MLLLAAVFVSLGVWQVQRRAWKHQLVATIDTRLRAAPVAPPAPADWPRVTADRDAYRRVTVTGRFLPGRDTFVRAATDLGSGYWMMTPLETGRFTVLVNRGFVTPDQRVRIRTDTDEPATVTGLLRISEPKGGFLRTNDPAGDRWYSRDVAAIAAARRLDHMAPYFIDADDHANAPGKPVGGLTVIRFNDNHLVYALTWFGMALLSLGAAWRFSRERRDRPDPAA
ncbi:SURF1 family protein [Sphingomonas sp. AP4-R1]|uniref:SURF1 family protein n=1 Tax=Sphingomonas sp. AP4-R1 TaxID=2735134 RepID=UPI0014937795|nr:SURF1 family protein [Sphingomonas sp. AP4-R1]QJU57709.1 SURF1 family protein [Sphingomonas sp. AP4-R1]